MVAQACEEDGSLGGGLVSDEGEVRADTALIPSTRQVSAPTFSGNQVFVSAGNYEDMLFGDQQVTALFQPALSSADLETITNTATAELELVVDEVYGNPNASTEFELNEITRRWRANAWRPDSVAAINENISLGTGTYQPGDDTLRIPVADSWLRSFQEYFEDNDQEGYRENMFGFALRAHDQGQILAFDEEQSRLVIDNQADTLSHTGFRSTAFSLQRNTEGTHESEGSTLVQNTFESFLKLEFEVDAEFIGSENISRAELVLYEDSELLRTTLAEGHQRNEAAVLDFYLLEESDLDVAIAEQPQFSVSKEEDGSYRMNLTGFVREHLTGELEEDREFYIVAGANNGKLVQTALYNHRDDFQAPKLLITSVEPD